MHLKQYLKRNRFFLYSKSKTIANKVSHNTLIEVYDHQNHVQKKVRFIIFFNRCLYNLKYTKTN